MRFIIVALIFLLLFPGASVACSFGPSLTDSTEPVTIKIGKTYFQVPENAFRHGHERAPVEREFVRLPFLKVGDEKFEVSLSLRQRSGPTPWEIYMDNGILVTLSSSSDEKALEEKVIPYLQSLASKEPPATWKRDHYLAERFHVGDYPCKSIGMWEIVTGLFGLLLDKFDNYSSDVIEGLQSKNSSIRTAAALAALRYKLQDKEVKQLLVKAIQEDKVEGVRAQARVAIREFARNDPTLIPVLRDLMKNGKNAWETRMAAISLVGTDPEFVPFSISLIPEANDGLKEAIRETLTSTVRAETHNSYPTTFEQLSPNSKKAIKAVLGMLFTSSDEKFRSFSMEQLARCGPAVATPEFVAYLNRVAIEGQLNHSSVAMNALKNMGQTPDKIDEIILRFEKAGDQRQADYLKRTFKEKQ
jgi:hypothetical protein